MDSSSAGLLHRLVALRPSSVLLGVTRRAADRGFAAEPEEAATTMVLGPLSLEQAVEAVIAASDDAPLLPREVRMLAERAAGSPLFLDEMLRALAEGGSVESLPASIDSAVTARDRPDAQPAPPGAAARGGARAQLRRGRARTAPRPRPARAGGDDARGARRVPHRRRPAPAPLPPRDHARHRLRGAAVPPAPRAARSSRDRAGERARRGCAVGSRAPLDALLRGAAPRRGLGLRGRGRRPCPRRVREHGGGDPLRARDRGRAPPPRSRPPRCSRDVGEARRRARAGRRVRGRAARVPARPAARARRAARAKPSCT